MNKPSDNKFKPTALNHAIRLACVSMATMPLITQTAFADSCGAGTTTISTVVGGDSCTLDAGESVDITAAGAITGTNPGIEVSGVIAGSITNAGTIDTTGEYGIYIYDSTLTGGIVNTGDILNATDMGVFIGSRSTVEGGITNSGTIFGETNGIAVWGGSTVSGGITNNAGGLIHSTDTYGIYIYDSTVNGGINNSGTILSDDEHGIFVGDGSIIRDGITNQASGLIRGESYGIYIYGATISGGINNHGTIDATDYDGIYIEEATITGGINNSGRIVGDTDDDYDYMGIRILSSTVEGGITNEAGALIQGGSYGLYIYESTISGGITNHGTIRGIDQNAVHIEDTIVNGDIVNHGTIDAPINPDEGSYGIYFYDSTLTGNLENTGYIFSATYSAIKVEDSTVSGSVKNSGTLETDSEAGIGIEDSTVSGDLINSGTIISEDEGILISTSRISGSVINTETGVIRTLDSTGIYIEDSTIGGNFENHGLIDQTSEQGVYIESSTVTGDIINTGTVLADESAFGIEDSTVGGDVNNSGVISGSYGLWFSSTTVAGKIYNSGTLIGTTNEALWFSNTIAPMTVINTGLIDGTVLLDTNTLVLAGDSGRVTGTTTGAAGSLVQVTGTFTPEADFMVDTFQVTNSGTLKVMNAFVPTSDASGVENSGLTLAMPGGGTITGNLTNVGSGASGTIIQSATSYGMLNVTGTADLSANNNVHVSTEALIADGTEFADIISAGTLTTGPGGLNTSDDTLFYDFVAVVDGNTVDITSERGLLITDAVEDADLGYAAGVAGELDTLLSAGGSGGGIDGILLALGQLESSEEVANAVAQLVPALATQGTQATTQNANLFSNVIGNRITGQRGLSAGDTNWQDDTNLWVKPFGGYADQNRRSGVPGFEADTIGVAFGADYQTNERLLLGAGFAFSETEVDGKTISNNALDVSTYQLVLYGNYDVNPTDFVEGYAMFGWSDNDTQRSIAFGGLTDFAEGDYDSWFTRVYAGYGRTYQTSDRFSFAPVATLRYTYIDQDGYTEDGAGALNLVVSGTDEDSLILGLDGVGTYKLDADGTYSVSVRGGIGYDVTNDRTIVTSTFAGGGGAFATRGMKADEFVYRGGFGIKAEPEELMQVRLDYEFEGRADYQSHGGSVKRP